MNREQAGNILDAYVSVCYALDADGNVDSDAKKAKKSLREVILDAMTSFKPATGGIVTTPYIGKNVMTIPTMYPTNWDGTPKVTCSGVDPAFNERTTGIAGQTVTSGKVCFEEDWRK